MLRAINLLHTSSQSIIVAIVTMLTESNEAAFAKH